jgi:hypothetical protein
MKLLRRKLMKPVIAGMAFALIATPSFALELNQVPAHVTETANHFAPDATWETAGTDYDTQLMMPEYEITGKTKDGKRIEVDVSAEGKLHEVETEVQASDMPDAAMKLVKTYLPDFAPTLVEKSARPNNVTFYELEGTVSGREVDIEVNEAGTEIIIADDSAI